MSAIRYPSLPPLPGWNVTYQAMNGNLNLYGQGSGNANPPQTDLGTGGVLGNNGAAGGGGGGVPLGGV